MSDTFTIDQFEWLRRVASDAGLSPAASRVAIALTRYFSREHGGRAWMSQATLARDLDVSVRTVSGALSALVKRGHLVAKRRGREETNLYHLAIKDGDSDRQKPAGHDTQEPADHERKKSADHHGVTGKNTSSDRQNRVKVTGKNLPTNPLNEPLEEPIEGIDSLQLDLGHQDSGRREVSPPSAPDTTGAGFEEFYRCYPKHVAKVAALKAYRAVISKRLATTEQLLNGAMRYAAERSNQDPKYTKHASTWLTGGCWDDEPAPTGGTTYSAGPPGRLDHIAIAEAMARQEQEAREAPHGR